VIGGACLRHVRFLLARDLDPEAATCQPNHTVVVVDCGSCNTSRERISHLPARAAASGDARRTPLQSDRLTRAVAADSPVREPQQRQADQRRAGEQSRDHETSARPTRPATTSGANASCRIDRTSSRSPWPMCACLAVKSTLSGVPPSRASILRDDDRHETGFALHRSGQRCRTSLPGTRPRRPSFFLLCPPPFGAVPGWLDQSAARFLIFWFIYGP